MEIGHEVAMLEQVIDVANQFRNMEDVVQNTSETQQKFLRKYFTANKKQCEEEVLTDEERRDAQELERRLSRFGTRDYRDFIGDLAALAINLDFERRYQNAVIDQLEALRKEILEAEQEEARLAEEYRQQKQAEQEAADAGRLDNLQTTLDIAGTYPGLGIFPDLANAAISAMRGNVGDAVMSLGCAIPAGPGQAVAGVKLSKKGLKVGAAGSKILSKSTKKLLGKAVKKTKNLKAQAQKAIDKAKEITEKVTGRAGKQKRLKELADDPNLGKADRGWLKQEQNAIKRKSKNAKGNVKKHIRNPPGKDLAHQRGREASKGYSYKHSDLKNKADHNLQHKYDKNGALNKERKP